MNNIFPFTLVDLTHTMTKHIASWNGSCGFASEIKLDYHECKNNVKFRVQQVKMHAGIGTHIDSPSHCIQNGITVDNIPLNTLIAPLFIIDVQEKIHENYLVSSTDIINFERCYRPIPEHCFVCIYTGWEQYWNIPERYHNNHVFPTVSKEAAELLLSRNIMGLGIDTLSPDLPTSGFPVHKIMLGNNKYIIENIANLQKMPITGAYVLTLPMKGEGLTEAPVRMIGLIRS